MKHVQVGRAFNFNWHFTGPGAILEALFAEISPHKIRSVAGTLSETSFWVSNIFYVFTFPLIMEKYGALAVLIFGLPLGLTIFYFCHNLPETTGKSVYDISTKMMRTNNRCIQEILIQDEKINTC